MGNIRPEKAEPEKPTSKGKLIEINMKHLILILILAITTKVSFSQNTNNQITIITDIDTLRIDTTYTGATQTNSNFCYNRYLVYLIDTTTTITIVDTALNTGFEGTLNVQLSNNRFSNIQYDTMYNYVNEFNISNDSLIGDTVFVRAFNNGNTWFKIIKVTQTQWDSIQNAAATAGIYDLELTTTRLSAYPNPASSNITIDFNVKTNEVPIAIFSMSGQLVYSNDNNRNIGANSLNVDVSGFKTGIYIVKAGSKYYKLIKK